MKKSILGFILGFIITIALIIAISTVAKEGVENINVEFSNIKIFVDGAIKISDDEPFIYNSRTYVPLRFVSEALGKTVNWDGETNSVHVGIMTSISFNDIFEQSGTKANVTFKKLLYKKEGYNPGVDQMVFDKNNPLTFYFDFVSSDSVKVSCIYDSGYRTATVFDEVAKIEGNTIKLNSPGLGGYYEISLLPNGLLKLVPVDVDVGGYGLNGEYFNITNVAG